MWGGVVRGGVCDKRFFKYVYFVGVGSIVS